jgi:hypothetical protein
VGFFQVEPGRTILPVIGLHAVLDIPPTLIGVYIIPRDGLVLGEMPEDGFKASQGRPAEPQCNKGCERIQFKQSRKEGQVLHTKYHFEGSWPVNEETGGVLEIRNPDESTTTRIADSGPIRGITMIFFGICCYIVFAAIYFLQPNKPVHSLGRMRFTVDALLEVTLTVLSLPAFFLVYRYGVKTYGENPEFPVSELMIDLLMVVSMIWVALSNGIHLTSKLVEQILVTSGGYRELACERSIHYLRQVVGHVAPHVGWQMLFAALMLGQLKRPYRGKMPTKSYVGHWGVIFGLLFTQGTIAEGCTILGFTLTLVSCALFVYLVYRLKLPSHETPVVRFFLFSQITSLLVIILYWSAYSPPS